MSNANFIVAYSYQDKFEIDETLAQALIHAKKTKQEGVEDRGRFYSAHYLWIMPAEETGQKLLTAKQMVEAGRIAEWLAMPIHELGWTEDVAVKYAMKLVGRVDMKELRKLDKWIGFEGSYPNAKRFLMEAKQLDNAPEMEGLLLESGV